MDGVTFNGLGVDTEQCHGTGIPQSVAQFTIRFKSGLGRLKFISLRTHRMNIGLLCTKIKHRFGFIFRTTALLTRYDNGNNINKFLKKYVVGLKLILIFVLQKFIIFDCYGQQTQFLVKIVLTS